MRSTTKRGLRVAAVTAAAALALSACGGDTASTDEESGAAGGDGSASDATFVFGASADPVILDGAYVSDGESLRVIRSIFEGLVTTEEGGTEIVPQLAEEWTPSEDGLEWVFDLREGVTFHDGEAFDAEAVCFNFDRWYNFTGIQQASNVSYYWSTVMGGFAENEDPAAPESLYSSCEATDELTATITLTRPSSTFLSALSLPAFSIGSPAALEEFGADEITGSGEEPQFTGTYGTENPTGTGPFRFVSWERGNQLVLERNDDYWGQTADIQNLVFRPIADGPARAQELQSGGIDAYDLVDPADVDVLESEGYTILRRPAFTVGYIGFNQAAPPLDNLQIRQAIAHAIDRENIISTNYPEGSSVPTQFMPESLFGYADDVTTYEYDPERARELIAESGVTDLTLEFLVPDRGLPALHAGPRRQLPADGGRPRGGRVHRRGDRRPLDAGLPGRRPERWRPDLPARLDGRLRRPGQLPGHVLPGPRPRLGLRGPGHLRPARPGRGRDRRRRPHGPVRGRQPADHGPAAGPALRHHRGGARAASGYRGLHAQPGLQRGVQPADGLRQLT